jgi:ABC-type nitrate/sulfonate/bicarbonate transport system substrate-binding protein
MGGGAERFKALMDRKIDATLLNTPFELLAQANGCNDIGAAIKVLHHYQGLVVCAGSNWAKAHSPELVGYIRGWLDGLDWLYEPDNKAEAIAILRKQMPNVTPDMAEKIYETLLVQPDGFFKKGRLDLKGVTTVLRLRSKYTGKKLSDGARYFDLTYYNRAVK